MNSAPIYLLNSSFQIQAVFDDYESAYYTRSLYRPGRFEIRINYNKPNASLFARDLFVLFGGDTRRIGIITSVKKKLGKSGKIDQVVYVSGYELRHIFERRITIPPGGQEAYTDKDVTETVVKSFLANQCIGSADANRNFAFLTIAADSARGPQVEISARLKNVGTTLWDICEQTDVGIKITASGSSGIVDTVHGVDRRSSQSVNPRAIFSISSDTAGEGEITDSDQKYRNLVYAAGQGEGVNRTILEVYSGGEPTGLTRREMYLDARDLEATADLQLRAENKLAEYGQTVTIDAEALQYSALQLGTDYDLGDLCTIEALGVTSDVRITEVKESWAVAKYEISLSFGKPQATITQQVAQIYSTGQSIQNFSEFGQNSSVTNIVPSIAPKYLGRYLASHPSSYNPNDWWTVYDSDDSPIERGVWYSNAGTPARITTSSSQELQGKFVAAIGDVAWAEDNGFGTATNYGIAVVYQSLGAVTAFFNSLFAQYIKIQTGGSLRGGDRYDENGTLLDRSLPGFYIPASGACKVAGIELSGYLGEDQVLGAQYSIPSVVGTALSFTTPALSQNAVASVSTPNVVLYNSADEALRLYTHNGIQWAQAGTPLAVAGANAGALARLNRSNETPFMVAFASDGPDTIRVYTHNGSAFTLLATSAVISGFVDPAICPLSYDSGSGDRYFAVADAGTDYLRAFKLSGTTISAVGTPLLISGMGVPALTPLKENQIAFVDGALQSLRVYEFNGSTWSQIGNSFSVTGIGRPDMHALNAGLVLFHDSTRGLIWPYTWDGQDFALEVSVSEIGGRAGVSSITGFNGVNFVFADGFNSTLSMYSMPSSVASAYKW